MWKLKRAEGGPWLKSKYNFVGRQVWEFDQELGTDAEKAEVERVRSEFTRNSSLCKQSSDLLKRMQFAKEKYCSNMEQQIKVKEGEEITEETVATALRRATTYFSTIQTQDGHWPADCQGPLFITTSMVIVLYITKSLNSTLSPEHQKEIRRYLSNSQNKDGGWGLSVEGDSIMFSTTHCYVALRILGVEADGGEDRAMEKARRWILYRGGIIMIPTWGKIHLSALGVYEWSGVNPVPPEFVLLPWIVPTHLGKLWAQFRFNFLPMTYLYGKKFVGPITDLILSLREELYCHPYHLVDWNRARKLCAKACGSQSWDAAFVVQVIIASNLVGEYETTLVKAYEFIKLSQITKNPSGDFVRYYRHMSKGGWAFAEADQGFQSSDTTAEALKNKDGGFGTYELTRTYTWVEKLMNASGFYGKIALNYSSVECTSSIIQALALFKKIYSGYRWKEIENCIQKATKYIESMQENDGSWYGSYGVCYTYGTWFAIEGLVACGKTYKNCSVIRKACAFLLSKQLSSGGWGESILSSLNMVYTNLDGNRSHLVNTAWAMLALIKVGQADRDPTPLHRAARIIINVQLGNGDFQEEEMRGSYNQTGLMNYSSYKNIFPIWALGEYRNVLLDSKKL